MQQWFVHPPPPQFLGWDFQWHYSWRKKNPSQEFQENRTGDLPKPPPATEENAPSPAEKDHLETAPPVPNPGQDHPPTASEKVNPLSHGNKERKESFPQGKKGPLRWRFPEPPENQTQR